MRRGHAPKGKETKEMHELRATFDAAHRAGMMAVKARDFRSLNEAISREQMVISKQEAAVEKQEAAIQEQVAALEADRRRPGSRKAAANQAHPGRGPQKGPSPKPDAPLAGEDVDREYGALVTEHRALEAEHRKLQEQRPKDLAEHAAHNQRLRDHVARLHRFIAAKGVQQPVLKQKR